MPIRDLLQAWISAGDDQFILLHANHDVQPRKDAWKPAAGEDFIQLRACEKIPKVWHNQEQLVSLAAVGERNCAPCCERWQTK